MFEKCRKCGKSKMFSKSWVRMFGKHWYCPSCWSAIQEKKAKRQSQEKKSKSNKKSSKEQKPKITCSSMVLVCDICSQKVRAGTGYALTTKQVVRNPRYWEYAFQHQWAYVGKTHEFLGEKIDGAEALAGLVSYQAGSRTPWLVCDKCIEIFEVDYARARELAKKFWSAPNAIRSGWKQDTGDAPFDESLEAAAEAWIKVFNTSPISTLLKQLIAENVGDGQVVYVKKEFLRKLEQKFKKRGSKERRTKTRRQS